MRDDRGHWYLFTGFVIGAVLGLVYAWLISPQEYQDTSPASLLPEFKDQYRAMIAAAFVATGNLPRAEARLALLGDSDIEQALTEQAQRTLGEGDSPQEAQALGLLAVALGQGDTGFLPSDRPSGTATAGGSSNTPRSPNVESTSTEVSSEPNMVRRALRNQELPTINALVDIGNVLSLRHLAPTGGHAIDVVTQDIALRPATGEEEFVPFGSEKVEHPLPGEIIFAEGNTVLTRRWTWRQANHTLTLPTTTAIEFNVDGLPPVPVAEVEEICQEVAELIGRFCGGRSRFELLTQENPRIGLTE